MTGEATRTLVVHVADWPLVAAGVSASGPAVVVRANRVVAASAAARAEGVVPGLRRRQAQARCPHVTVLDHDPARDARAFEPVAGALDVVTPRLELSRPGTLAFATRGPSRYFGGDEGLAERTGQLAAGALAAVVGAPVAVGVGVADGSFTAVLVARRALRQAGPTPPAEPPGLTPPATAVLAPGASPTFLAPLPVAALGQVVHQPDLIDLWGRLGLRTLGLVAALPVADVLGRFGHDGVVAHRLAAGLDPFPLDPRPPADDLTVTREVDPPAEQVDRAAFVAKALADELHARLTANGLACTHVLVEAETEHGESLARAWRHDGTLDAGALADRVRWQLDGWLTGSATMRPTAGITRLTLVPLAVVAASGRQLGFWGGETRVDERIVRAVARVEGIVGEGSVTVPEARGGRGPGERVVRVPVGAVDLTAPRPAARPAAVVEPWPGRVPAPSPSSVATDPEPVEVADVAGRPVRVSARAEVSAAPAHLARPGRPATSITAWAGPWPVDERWWDPVRHRRRARFQVVTDDGSAHLLSVEGGRWWREATYE